MTTFIRQQPGLPASEYAGHVERVLSKRAKEMLAADLASSSRPLHEQRWPTDAIADECERQLAVPRVLSKSRRPVPVWLLWLLVAGVNLAALFLVALTLFL